MHLARAQLTITLAVEPAKYDFSGTRAIAIYDDDASTAETTSDGDDKESGVASPVEKSSPGDEEAKNNVSTDVVAVVETDNEAVSRAELKVVFKRAAWYSLALTLAVAVLGELVLPMIQPLQLRQVAVPIPMFFSHYVFSKGFYTFWVACTM